MGPQTKFVFPSAYGGPVCSNDPPLIHEYMKKLRVEIGAIEAKKSADKFGPKFPVRGAKDLAQKLANALNKLNMEAPVVFQEITFFDTDKIPGNERQSGNPVFRTLAHVKATVRIIAPDTSFIDVVGSGHGGDVDDKSGGKASTYAWKDALLKGLSIPHEDMVDTDDDSTSAGEESGGGGKAGRNSADKGRKGSVGRGSSRSQSKVQSDSGMDEAVDSVSEGATEDSNAEGLAYVLAKIAESNTDADLEQIREAIKSGVMHLEGSDRLTATKVWMERKKEIYGK